MSTRSRTVWWGRLPLVFPCCQTPFPAVGFALMMQQVRGHYPLKTCLEGCCSPRFLGWQRLQHCCSLSTGKGSGWKKSSTDWMTYFKAFCPHKTCYSKVNFIICSNILNIYSNQVTKLDQPWRSWVKNQQQPSYLVTLEGGMGRNVQVYVRFQNLRIFLCASVTSHLQNRVRRVSRGGGHKVSGYCLATMVHWEENLLNQITVNLKLLLIFLTPKLEKNDCIYSGKRRKNIW